MSALLWGCITSAGDVFAGSCLLICRCVGGATPRPHRDNAEKLTKYIRHCVPVWLHYTCTSFPTQSSLRGSMVTSEKHCNDLLWVIPHSGTYTFVHFHLRTEPRLAVLYHHYRTAKEHGSKTPQPFYNHGIEHCFKKKKHINCSSVQQFLYIPGSFYKRRPSDEKYTILSYICICIIFLPIPKAQIALSDRNITQM